MCWLVVAAAVSQSLIRNGGGFMGGQSKVS